MNSAEVQVTHISQREIASQSECTKDETSGLSPADSGENSLHQEEEALQQVLNKQTDMVIDFSSLKSCLNPMGIRDKKEKRYYQNLVCELIENQEEKLPNLQSLTIRRLSRLETSIPDYQLRQDYYAQFKHGIMQLSCLTELDLCDLPLVVHDKLQLWNLHNLKKLSITNSQLQSLPGSVGRLKKLEELDLSNNKLSSLPITLSFCKKLNTLDLHQNNFIQLPGVIQRLHNIKTLRRLQNPLTQRYNYREPHFTKTVIKSATSKLDKKVYQPISLQASCTTVVFTSKLEYWELDTIGPLQCKTLDKLSENFVVCDNCDRMLTDQVNILAVEAFLVTYAELSGVPFLFYACKEDCQKELMTTYGEKNVQLQEKMDMDYEESIKQALKQAEQGKVVPVTPPKYSHNHNHGRYRVNASRSRRKKCSIM